MCPPPKTIADRAVERKDTIFLYTHAFFIKCTYETRVNWRKKTHSKPRTGLGRLHHHGGAFAFWESCGVLWSVSRVDCARASSILTVARKCNEASTAKNSFCQFVQDVQHYLPITYC